MPEEDVDLWVDALMLKINAITGWTIPSGVVLTVFTDQLKKKMAESYSTVNGEEVEYAFRNYGTEVKDWGKQMNLSLLDQVLIPYLKKRASLSEIEEQTEPIKMIEHKEDTSDKAMEDWYAETCRRVQQGECTVDFIPIMLYEWKDSRGEIKVSTKIKHEYLAKAMEHRYNKLQEECEKKPDVDARRSFEEFSLMREEGCAKGKEIDMLKGIAKRMIMYDIIKGNINVC